MALGSWRHDSVVESTSGSTKGPGFGSQHWGSNTTNYGKKFFALLGREYESFSEKGEREERVNGMFC